MDQNQGQDGNIQPGYDADIDEASRVIEQKIRALDTKRDALLNAYNALQTVMGGTAVESVPQGDIPLTQEGTPDRRTKEGRLAADDEAIGLDNIDWNNLPMNEDKTIDQRTKTGRALKAAGMLDDQGRLKDGHGHEQYARATGQSTTPSTSRPAVRPTPSFTSRQDQMSASRQGQPRRFE